MTLQTPLQQPDDSLQKRTAIQPELDSEDGASLMDFLIILAHRKWLIVKITGTCAVLGIILSWSIPSRYTATCTIMSPKQTQSTTSFLNEKMGSMADMAAGGMSMLDPNGLYLGLLESRPIADGIINKIGLQKIYHARDMTAARKILKSNTKIVSEKSTLITISVTDENKKRAADIANAYSDELRILSKNISFTEASRRREFFEVQLKAQKEILIQAEVNFQQLQEAKGLVHMDAQAGMILSNLAGLRGEIAAKQVQLDAMRSYSTERNPEVELAEREIASLQGEANSMETRGQPAGYANMSLKDVPKEGLDYLRAARELSYQQAFFDTLLRQYEAAHLDEVKEAAVVQVVETAIEPERRSTPKRSLIVLGFALGGFLIGCSIVWFKNDSLVHPDKYEGIRKLKLILRGK